MLNRNDFTEWNTWDVVERERIGIVIDESLGERNERGERGGVGFAESEASWLQESAIWGAEKRILRADDGEGE